MPGKLTVLTALCALLVASPGSTAPPAHAAGGLNGYYDWTVRVETQQLERYFDYSKSGLRPLDRIYIDYYAGEDEKSASGYEKLWYHDGTPLGLERYQALSDPDHSVKSGENVRLRINPHKKGKATPGELKAAANTILRVWLDLQLNKNQLRVVEVPTDSLQAIADELVRNGKLVVVSQSDESDVEFRTGSPMTLLLESEPDGKQISLAYM